MTELRGAEQLSVTEATQRGVARLVADAEHGASLVITRDRRPVAAVVGMRWLAAREEVASELHGLALAMARSVADTGSRTLLEDVMAAFGHTCASIAALTDD